ncbi:MAG: radical SAM protein [Magnetovibrio sp.]|nr:radical SAM protein [Magnetovibrio sp.]
MKYLPGYIRLHEEGVLEQRVSEAIAGLGSCRVCPWNCEIDRLADKWKIFRTGRYARVSSHFPHFGEEDCLRGTRGSGTIFFAWCNLRCVFCQNFDISQQEAGSVISPKQLAAMMLQLQETGCHNINWVTPEHVVPQILEALPAAIEGGLKLPIVYNTSAFDSMESLRLMDGIVDIYMPDFKYWSPEQSKHYLKTPDYPHTARSAIREMHRQVGDLELDEQGMARKGLLVRHLVMPGGLEETREIMRFLAQKVSRNTYVNIMGQYHPAAKVDKKKFPEINRRTESREIQQAFEIASEEGLWRFDERRMQVRLF